ncbi:MAG: DUF885 domain-containing protein [Firmicutes bacterium]|nr:DUF885 domain-containing protein [Bacillota bacterium]
MRKLSLVLCVFLIVFSFACSGSDVGSFGRFDYIFVEDRVPDLEYGFSAVDIDDFFDEYFRQLVRTNPQFLSVLGDAADLPRRDGELNDYSYGYMQWQLAFDQAAAQVLAGFADQALSEQQRLNKAIMEASLATDAEFMYHGYLVNQHSGLHTSFPTFMENVHQIESVTDAENYISRIEAFPQVMEQYITGIKIQTDMGIIPPDYIIESVLAAIADFIAHEPEDNPLFIDFAEKMQRLEDAPVSVRDGLYRRLETEIEQSVYPAFQRLGAYIQTFRGQGVSHGVWELPDGDRYYQELVRYYTTTDLTPEEIFELGQAEVERIQREIRAVLMRLGYPAADIPAALQEVAWAGVVEDQEEILAIYREILAETEALLPELFDTLPETAVEIRPMPDYRSVSYPSHYVIPARDGSRPGVFNVNLHGPHFRYQMKNLAYHETVPGHHLQIALQREQAEIPLFRDLFSFTAFEEGWAMYAEGLLLDAGLDEDLEAKLAWLEGQLTAAALLVVDTGIHYKQWTRRQAFEYLYELTGRQYDVDRYIARPGQVLAYYIGMLKFRELRELAETELGSAFDIREFHNTVLLNGSMPLSVLEEQVERYIEERRIEQDAALLPAS